MVTTEPVRWGAPRTRWALPQKARKEASRAGSWRMGGPAWVPPLCWQPQCIPTQTSSSRLLCVVNDTPNPAGPTPTPLCGVRSEVLKSLSVFSMKAPQNIIISSRGGNRGGPILCTLEGVGKVGEHLRWGPFTVLSRIPRCGRSPQRTRQVLPLPPASLPSFLPQTLTELILPGAQRGAAERAGKGS